MNIKVQSDSINDCFIHPESSFYSEQTACFPIDVSICHRMSSIIVFGKAGQSFKQHLSIGQICSDFNRLFVWLLCLHAEMTLCANTTLVVRIRPEGSSELFRIG